MTQQVLKTERLNVVLENVQSLPMDTEKGRLVYLLQGSRAYLNVG